MDQIVNQLRSERQDENYGQDERLENFSNGNSNQFDRTASLVSGNAPRNLARRPMTRAAGYDSRQ